MSVRHATTCSDGSRRQTRLDKRPVNGRGGRSDHVRPGYQTGPPHAAGGHGGMALPGLRPALAEGELRDVPRNRTYIVAATGDGPVLTNVANANYFAAGVDLRNGLMYATEPLFWYDFFKDELIPWLAEVLRVRRGLHRADDQGARRRGMERRASVHGPRRGVHLQHAGGERARETQPALGGVVRRSGHESRGGRRAHRPYQLHPAGSAAPVRGHRELFLLRSDVGSRTHLERRGGQGRLHLLRSRQGLAADHVGVEGGRRLAGSDRVRPARRLVGCEDRVPPDAGARAHHHRAEHLARPHRADGGVEHDRHLHRHAGCRARCRR